MTKFLAFLGVLVMAGVLIYLAIPPGVPKLFDGNLTRLAQTDAEGYCSGLAFFRANSAEEAKDIAAGCREDTTLSTTVDLARVTMAFCLGAKKGGYTGSIQFGCVDVLKSLQFWPMYDGGITDAWTRSHPYPLNLLESSVEIVEDNSRTGGRPGIENR
jgi:hypothetical protein